MDFWKCPYFRIISEKYSNFGFENTFILFWNATTPPPWHLGNQHPRAPLSELWICHSLYIISTILQGNQVIWLWPHQFFKINYCSKIEPRMFWQTRIIKSDTNAHATVLIHRDAWRWLWHLTFNSYRDLGYRDMKVVYDIRYEVVYVCKVASNYLIKWWGRYSWDKVIFDFELWPWPWSEGSESGTRHTI